MFDFKVAKSLKLANSFYLNINFEILNGCKFKCKGCFVEKNAQTPFLQQNLEGLEQTLDSFSKNSYQPFLAFLGPTDFLVSSNLEVIFKNYEFVKLLKRFKRIVFQTTFADISNSELAIRILKEHFSEHELEINTVFEPFLINNKVAVEKILKNRKEFLTQLARDDVRSFTIFNVYNYEDAKQAHLLKDYEKMDTMVKDIFKTTIDYNFSSGRNKDLNGFDFLKLTDTAKNLFDSSIVDEESAKNLRFSFGKIHDSLLEVQLNYRGGAYYYSPLLYERFVSFNEDLKISEQELSSMAYEKYQRDITLEQYRYSAQTESCENCGFLGACVDRGILKLMKMYEVDECIVAKKAWERTSKHFECEG